MNKIVLTFLSVALISAVTAQTNQPIGTIEYVSDDLNKLIKKDAKVEIVAEGFQFTEGPVWLSKQKMLLFSDVPANAIYKWTEAKGKEAYLKPAGYTGTEPRGGFMGPNGLYVNKGGQLFICQHGDRRVAVMNAPIDAPQPNFLTIAGEYNGKKLNSPNDFYFTKSGDMYFTDPGYGLEKGAKDPKKELAFHGVYRKDKDGRTTLLVDSIEQPNGIGIFPDGKTLLVANSDNQKKRWYAYDIMNNGSLTNARIFYDVSDEKAQGGCDGFKIDKKGNVFAAGPGGIWIFTKNGKLIGKINMNGVTAANCALTPDGKTLFITATNYLLRVKMR